MRVTNAVVSPTYRFYTSSEYWPELISSIEKTQKGERVALMTMDFDPVDTAIAAVLRALLQAALRGVNVYVVLDARPFLFNPKTQRLGPLWYGTKLDHVSATFKPCLDAIELINSQPSSQAVIVNKPSHRFSNPYAGRSHIKFSVINDDVFIGGCNLSNSASLDIMVRLGDAHTADYICNFMHDAVRYEQIGRALGWQDQRQLLDSLTTLFIDAGKRRQSIIFEQALQLIDDAKETVTMTCQFFPNSITARHLLAARKRGVTVTIIFSHPSKHGRGIGGLGQYYSLWREKRRLPKELFAAMMDKSEPLLHAKLLVSDVGTMIGSHNYVRAGVLLGTAEICLLSRDPAFGESALNALKRELTIP
jgi:phosphatidylserine/phosphatidylglycerophosphate/cardiolipin synthase-like enzyme